MALQRLRDACEAYDEREEDDEEEEMAALEAIRDAAFSLIHEDGDAVDSNYTVQLTPHEHLPFTFGGVDFGTAFNAFQAQKAPSDRRAEFTSLHIQEATDLGRTFKIDVRKWNSGRKDLMYKILKSQASQHDELRERIVEHGDCDKVGMNGMGVNVFWETALPEIWNRLHAYFVVKPAKKAKRV